MSSVSEPQFSVIIPVHDGARYVARCLRSVLDQSFRDFEVIIVDDGSTDGTAAEIAKFRDPRCRVLRRDKGGPGPGPARNLGIAAARFAWCAFLDVDDRWAGDYLERMAEALQQLPTDVGLLFSGFDIVDNDNDDVLVLDSFYAQHKGPGTEVFNFADFLAAWIANGNSPNRTSATIVRTTLLREMGGFSEDARCRRGQDKDAWLRAAAKARAAYISFVGMVYRRADVCDSIRATWHTQAPCLCHSIASLLTEAPSGQHRRLLRRLQNREILHYVVEGSRVMRVPRGVFADFFIAQDPLLYALIIGLWIGPRPLLNRLRKMYRRETPSEP